MFVLGCLWKIIKTALMIIGAITVIIAIVIGVFLWNFSQPTAIEKEMHDVPYSEEAAQDCDNAWDQFKLDAQQSPVGTVVKLILSEEEVSSKLMKEIGEVGLPMDVKKAWVNFLSGSAYIRVAAVGGILGIDVHIAAEGEVEIRQDEETGEYVLWYDLSDIDLGRAPENIKNIIMENIGQELTGTWEPPEDCPVDLTSINVEEGNLVLEGTTIEWGEAE